jgi:hypothetical protein
MEQINSNDLPDDPREEWVKASRKGNGEAVWIDRPSGEARFRLDEEPPLRPGGWIVWTASDGYRSVAVAEFEDEFDRVADSD